MLPNLLSSDTNFSLGGGLAPDSSVSQSCTSTKVWLEEATKLSHHARTQLKSVWDRWTRRFDNANKKMCNVNVGIDTKDLMPPPCFELLKPVEVESNKNFYPAFFTDEPVKSKDLLVQHVYELESPSVHTM